MTIMRRQMIATMLVLLASGVAEADSTKTTVKSSRMTAVRGASAVAGLDVMRKLQSLQLAAARRRAMTGASAAGENIRCSYDGDCSTDGESNIGAANRTHKDKNSTAQPRHSVDPAAVRCGPSPLAAAEIEALVGRIAVAQGVDPQLAKAVAFVESRFDRVRNSPKGARGPMQLMPATALDLGVADVCDPLSNIDGGVRHLKRLLRQFGNPLLAVAAYNAGSRAVIDHNGIPPFAETLRYVAQVVGRQLGAPPLSPLILRPGARNGVAAIASLQVRDDAQAPRAAPHRFINGVMHLPSPGGSQ